MRRVPGRVAMAVAAAFVASGAGVGLVGADLLPHRQSVAAPTQARTTASDGRTLAGTRGPEHTHAAAQPVGTDPPADAQAGETSASPPGLASTYATERPVPDLPLSTLPVPTGTDTYGDPNAVVIRRPARDYGSGYHGDYGRFTRQTSPDAQLQAAVASTNGCLIIGDSIATSVVADLVADLRSTLGATCVYDTWPGRATEGTANALLDLKRRHGLPQRVVVMSGTNDIFNPPLFETQMNRIVDGIGPGHDILWVTTFDSRRPKSARSAADERNTAWINTVIEARAARTPHMRLIDWDALFRTNPPNVDALLKDGVHPNRQGVDAMVGLVRRSLA